MLRRTMDSLSEEEFARVPGDSSPPVGWHLWHIARWSDRFQATLADRDEPSEIWVAERLPEALGLEPDALGVLQLGMSMDAKDAQLLPAAMGKQRFDAYLGRVLDALHTRISEIEPTSLLASRMSIREYADVNGTIQYAPAQESTLLADILFHLTHSSRHLGSIEALRGL